MAACQQREYPRVYGDNQQARGAARQGEGIPPRVQGQPQHKGAEATASRNTPACTGTTRMGSAPIYISAEYPRVYGDNVNREYRRTAPTGIPPRVRGQPLLSNRYYHLIV